MNWDFYTTAFTSGTFFITAENWASGVLTMKRSTEEEERGRIMEFFDECERWGQGAGVDGKEMRRLGVLD